MFGLPGGPSGAPARRRLAVLTGACGLLGGQRRRVDQERKHLAGVGVPRSLDAGEVRLAADLELGVGALAHQLDELAPVAAEDRLAADVRLGVARAVPVEVVATGPPAAAVVLGDGDLLPARPVGQLDLAVGAADRQLPADVGLDRVRLLAVSTACWCSAHPAPAGKPGRLRKMQAPSTTLVLRASSSVSVQAETLVEPGCSCHSSSPSSLTTFLTRLRSSSSVKWAPRVQQPSSGRSA